MTRLVCCCVLGGLAAASPSLLAQREASQSPTGATVAAAVATITTEEFRAKLGALAHDSTRGRETPSPELDRATNWVAIRFASAGLSPAGDDGGYLQRFRLRQAQLDSLTVVSARGGDASARWTLGNEIVYAGGGDPPDIRNAPVVLLAGLPTDSLRPFGDVSLEGAVLLHVLAFEQFDPQRLNPVSIQADAEGAVAHIVSMNVPDELWERLVRGTYARRWKVVGAADGDRLGVYGLRLEAAADLLAAAGEDVEVLTTPAGQGIRMLDGFHISFAPHWTALDEATVANVVGVLEGSDPTLRNQAIVFTSHIDHVGVIPGRCRPSEALPADSVCNGADDNASGTVGIIELAEAYATLDARPARTLVFAAVTAEERGLFGSRYYVAHPVIPLERTAAVVNLDMIARNPRDTVGTVGRHYTSLGAVVDRVASEHPELRLTLTEHEGLYPNSDHYPFAQRGVPALFFFSGLHEDLHTAADNPDRADPEQAARILRLVFYVGLEAANAVGRPVWDPEARAQVVTR